jgi:pterin-4a-carbinolamine dehydratase
MADNLDALASNTVSRTALTAEQLQTEVASLGARWSISTPQREASLRGPAEPDLASAGEHLRLELRGAPMAKYGAAAAHAAVLADEMDHHPTIVMDYGGLTLTINTHDKKAITVMDLVYAARLERWLRAAGW